MTQKLILVDASGYIYRAFYALPPLKDPKGIPVGALYGFSVMMMNILEEYKNDHVLAIFDSSRESFRKNIYPTYKAHRSETPEDLIPQFDLVREACDAFHIPRVELDGYEADDLIASYAKQMRDDFQEIVILSSDKDLMQLVGEKIYMIDPIKEKKIDPQAVFEKFGVSPEQVIDVQALIGDSSDNIPGAPGIGPKTAAELIALFGSLENLLLNIDAIKQPSRKKSLSENIDLINLSKELVTLKTDLTLEKLEPLEKISLEKVGVFFEKYGFKKLLARFILSKKESPAKVYRLIQDVEAFDEFIHQALKYEMIALDTETTSLDTMAARLVGISLSYAPFTGVYIPLSHQGLGIEQLSLEIVSKKLQSLLLDRNIKKVGHNIKYDLSVLERHGIYVKNIEDTMVMSYVLDSAHNGHGMDELAKLHLDHINIPYKEVTSAGKKQVTFDYVDLESARDYAAEDADITLRLYNIFKSRIQDEDKALIYERLDKPLITVLLEMEQNGVMIDGAYLNQLSGEFSLLLMELEKKIYHEVGMTFNIGSPKQLSEILFGRLKLPPPKPSKTGQYSTNSDVLEELVIQGFDIAQMLLDWRGLAKLKSTYTDALFLKINPETKRIHTCFAQTITSTGRLSSSDPNLQNIPIRTAEGKKIRGAFIAPVGYKLLSFDYSQIELRILADMASIPTLKKYFVENRDIHVQTAAQIFGVPESQVTGDLRRQAKTINFGIIYGMSPFGLAQALKIPQNLAKEYIDVYFKEFPEIKTYMDVTKDFAEKNGYVLTLTKRKCFIPGISDKNGNVRAFAQRQAINAPIQGTNADMIKEAMILINEFLKRENFKTKMILQVHDELLFEVPEDELEVVVPHIKDLMEKTNLSIPTPVNYKIGDTWAQIHD